jgi:hypothetical protein
VTRPVTRYGFIQPDDGAADVFVPISAVKRSGIGNSARFSTTLGAAKLQQPLGGPFEQRASCFGHSLGLPVAEPAPSQETA